jgi:DTW domain-containing protein
MPREYCPQCNKVLVACYCKIIPRFKIDTDIIILQHPSESKHPLATAKIAAISLAEKCLLLVGEDFMNHPLLCRALDESVCYLVFPRLSGNQAVPLDSTKIKKTYIFLDGTWNKAKKIYFKNPLLHKLPHLELQVTSPSRYYLRQVPKANYLSTLEAVVEVLKQECNTDISEVLSVMDYIQHYQQMRMINNIGSF